MPLKKDYFKCLSLKKNKKKNGQPYLFLKLQNSREVVGGYLWERVELYDKRISSDGLYAIKYQEERYNGSRVLNIKNINSITGSRYQRYGYSDRLLLMSESVRDEYFFNEISSFIVNRNNPLMDILCAFTQRNKELILSSRCVEHKYLCLEYFQLIENTLNKSLHSSLYIYFILIDRLDLDINALTLEVQRHSGALSEALLLYLNDNKGFIKKYKSIVDLINDNFNNYTNLKTQAKGANE